MVSDPDIKFGGSYFADFTDNSKDIIINKSNSNISKPSKSSSDSHEIKPMDPIQQRVQNVYKKARNENENILS